MSLYNSIRKGLKKVVKDNQLWKYFSILDSDKIDLPSTEPDLEDLYTPIGISFKSDIITFYTINGEIPLYGERILSSVKEDPNTIDKIIEITNKNLFKATDKIIITFFSASTVVDIVETYGLSKENFIKIWNTIFEEIFINYRIDQYYQ